MPGAGGRACPTCWWPAWAAARTRSASSTRSWTTRWRWSAWRRADARRSPGEHAARFLGEGGGGVGVLHGTRTYLLQDEAGNVLPTHSVSAGLDYPAVGPEHALLHDEGRVRYDVARATTRRWPRFHLLARDRGHPPRAGVVARLAWVVREARRRWQGRTVAREPQRPRRQGPGTLVARSRPRDAASAIASRGCGATERQGLRGLRDRGRSLARAHGRDRAASWRRPASTCWSWACRSRTRWPTAP